MVAVILYFLVLRVRVCVLGLDSVLHFVHVVHVFHVCVVQFCSSACPACPCARVLCMSLLPWSPPCSSRSACPCFSGVLHVLFHAVCVLPLGLHDFRPVFQLLHLLHVLNVLVPLVLYIR